MGRVEGSAKQNLKHAAVPPPRRMGAAFNERAKGYWLGRFLFGFSYGIVAAGAFLVGGMVVNTLFFAITAGLLLTSFKLFFARFFVKVRYSGGAVLKAEKGQPFQIQVSISNRGIFSYSVGKVFLTKSDELVLAINDDCVLCNIPARKKISLVFGGTCRYRGEYRFSVRMLQVWDDLGFRYIRKKDFTQMIVYVYPRITDLRCFDGLQTPDTDAEESIARKTQDPSDSFEVREYIPQDSMRHIHWKVTARMDRLMTKTFDQMTNHRICIYLDMTALQPTPDALQGIRTEENKNAAAGPFSNIQAELLRRGGDKYMELAAAVCAFCSRTHVPYSFLYPVHRADCMLAEAVLCKNPEDFSKIHFLTASLPFRPEYGQLRQSLYPLLQEGIYGVLRCYLFTLGLSSEIIAAAEDLSDRGYFVTVIAVCDTQISEIIPQCVTEEARLLKKNLHGQELRVLKVGLEDDTKDVLERFA